jgi:hypothetical protein
MAAISGTSSLLLAREPGWIYRKWWDLPFLLLSAALVPLPFLAAWLAERSAWLTGPQAIDLVNITVAALVGGPHLFSTATMTFLDPAFRRRHPVYLWSSLLLPGAVVYLGIYAYAVLIQFFFAWASLHVLHQMIFLADCYRERAGRPDPGWSRALDYGLILTGLYPVGLDKIAQNQFHVGGVLLRYPDWARPLHLPEAAGALFAALAAAWLAKTFREHARGVLSTPKTLLIGLVTVVSFLLPLGRNLDILFQGYNAWHSFQYLFLLWFVNRLRRERGGDQGVAAVAARGMLPYYAWLLGATAVLVLLTLLVRAATTLGPDRSYFVVVLSILLMHYWFDHFLFTRTEMVA